jgi:dTDP-glucose pyrophosphorylase
MIGKQIWVNNDFSNVRLAPSATIRKAMQVIDQGALKMALVLDHDDKLLGILTDGDIRRGLLNGLDFEESIQSIMQRNPITCQRNESKSAILEKALGKRIYQLPIVDEYNRVVGIQEVESFFFPTVKKHKVVLMAGGLGIRLRPLTESTPKPMIRVGNKPIIETIIESFKQFGFIDFIISVNYRADVLQNYFGHGENHGVKIEFIHESEQMGTAGALNLMRDKLSEPFIVMNGDLLTTLNFENFLDFHLNSESIATMAVYQYNQQIPYGVVKQIGDKMMSIEEKPIHQHYINAGIYAFQPEILNFLPQEGFFDMVTLFNQLIAAKQSPSTFPIHEYWMDIGRLEELEQARLDYKGLFTS